jgi:hypothetical protein
MVGKIPPWKWDMVGKILTESEKKDREGYMKA